MTVTDVVCELEVDYSGVGRRRHRVPLSAQLVWNGFDGTGTIEGVYLVSTLGPWESKVDGIAWNTSTWVSPMSDVDVRIHNLEQAIQEFRLKVAGQQSR